MESIIPFGNSWDNDHQRYTQYIVDYRKKNTTILDPEMGQFVKYNITNPRNLSLKYNNYKASSFVISTDLSSFNESADNFVNFILTFFTNGGGSHANAVDVITNLMYTTADLDFVGVVERHNVKGWHLHLIVFHRNNYLDEKEFNAMQTHIHSEFNRIIKDHETMDSIFINCKTVKSVGSIINYIKKDPYYLISSTLELAQMYIHFDRLHIFAENTAPKFTHAKNYNLPVSSVVEYFERKLEEGCIDFAEALQDDYAKNFLGNRNLNELFENTRTHYLAKRKFKDSVHEIIKKFLFKDEGHKKCICPIFEYLKIQQIDILTFEKKFVQWFQCNSKKNTIALVGPADTGKSVFLSSLHQCFRFANRLTTDGIFTFANAINADVIYHEEPFIAPETAELAKLVYEGNPASTVAVKNRPSTRLNKKIPVLITANSPVYKYVSGQRDAFDARMHVFTPQFKLSGIKFCDDDTTITHRCVPLNLDIKRRAYKSIHGTSGNKNQWLLPGSENEGEEDLLQSTSINDNCTLIHKLHKHHWRTFIVYIIFKYSMFEYYDYFNSYLRDNQIDIIDFFDQDVKDMLIDCSCVCYQFVK